MIYNSESSDERPELVPAQQQVPEVPLIAPDDPDLGKYRESAFQLEKQNQFYRRKIAQANQSLNKLQNSAKSKQAVIRNLQNQLASIRTQLQNTEKHTEIYKKQLKRLSQRDQGKKAYDVVAEMKYEVEEKRLQLETMRREVKALDNTNKALQKKLFKYSHQGKTKNVDSNLKLMHQILNENQRLKQKLEKYSSNQKKKGQWLSEKQQSVSLLKRRVSLLPDIASSKTKSNSMMLKRKSMGSLGKLEAEKDVYERWLEVKKPKKQEKLEKEIEHAETTNDLLRGRYSNSLQEFTKMQNRLKVLKQKVTPEKIVMARQVMIRQQEHRAKLRSLQVNCDIRFRQERRDWIGMFTGIRFSDSRFVRQEARLYKIVYNDMGFYQFHYYLVKSPKEKLPSPLSSEFDQLKKKGKQSSFAVEYPDYIKDFKLKFNLTANTIVGLQVVSNLGLVGQFSDSMQTVKASPQKNKGKFHQEMQNPTEDTVMHSFNIKVNEAPRRMFGSYLPKYDDKKNLLKVSLEGLGAELIEDYVQQLM